MAGLPKSVFLSVSLSWIPIDPLLIRLQLHGEADFFMDGRMGNVDRTVDVATRALQGLWASQRAIANNIANVDTPGYQVERFDFDRYMSDALSESGARPTSTYLGNMTRTSFRTDGNSVDIDSEMVLLTETSLRYQAVLSQLERKMALLSSVIRDS